MRATIAASMATVQESRIALLNDAGLRRKGDIDAYLERIEGLKEGR